MALSAADKSLKFLQQHFETPYSPSSCLLSQKMSQRVIGSSQGTQIVQFLHSKLPYMHDFTLSLILMLYQPIFSWKLNISICLHTYL